MTDWWAGLAPITVPIDCSGREHTLTWEQGELHVPSHPSADRERTLVALGADPFPCLLLHDTWRAHMSDLDVLSLAARAPGDRLVRPPGPTPSSPAGAVRYVVTMTSSRTGGPRPPRASEPLSDLQKLLLVDPLLAQRLTVTVVAHWSAVLEAAEPDQPDSSVEGTLWAALYGRLVWSLEGWLGGNAPVDVRLGRPNAEASLRRSDRGLVAELPFSWLRDVWARGLSVVLGHFCLGARSVGPGSWQIRALTPDLRPVDLTIALPDPVT